MRDKTMIARSVRADPLGSVRRLASLSPLCIMGELSLNVSYFFKRHLLKDV